MYGVRQATRAWYSKLNNCLEKIDFERCPYEHAVYIKKEGDNVLIVAVDVDDLLVTGSDVKAVKKFK